MMQTYHQSIPESSDDSLSSNTIQVIHHVLIHVLKLIAVDRVSVHYHDINELCGDLQFVLKYIHDYSDYIVNQKIVNKTFHYVQNKAVH